VKTGKQGNFAVLLRVKWLIRGPEGTLEVGASFPVREIVARGKRQPLDAMSHVVSQRLENGYVVVVLWD